MQARSCVKRVYRSQPRQAGAHDGSTSVARLARLDSASLVATRVHVGRGPKGDKKRGRNEAQCSCARGRRGRSVCVKGWESGGVGGLLVQAEAGQRRRAGASGVRVGEGCWEAE
eukprot:608635-Pleurochrysis_carterae.AAC.1